jgi:hypothetical protein
VDSRFKDNSKHTAAEPLGSHQNYGRKLMIARASECLLSPKKLQLSIKAELENVTDLVPASDDFEWFFKVIHWPILALYYD